MTMQRLQNKVAIITGGNSGIGKGIAKHFIDEGAKVVIFGRNAETLKECEKEFGKNALVVQGDVTNSQDLINLYDSASKHFGKIDVVVANSGVGERLPIDEVTEEKFDHLVDINYRGAYFTIKYALKFLNSPASIILMSSCAATITIKNHSVYASTKAAIKKLAKNLAYDLAPRNIRVNSISPGYIRTPIFTKRLKTDPAYLKRREALIPLNRIGEPQDIAQAALFLATPESSYITGIDLLVDGGFSASFREEA